MTQITEPLTDEEYAEWKDNIETIAEIHRGPWYRKDRDGLVPTQEVLGDNLTTTVGIQLRLFATIDALHTELQEAREKLDAVRVLANGMERHIKQWKQVGSLTAAETLEAVRASLDRILEGSE